MVVRLSGELERRVLKKVETGRYGSVDDVVREALQVLDERDQGLDQEDRATAFKAEIEKRLASGPATPMDFPALKKRLREEIPARRQARS